MSDILLTSEQIDALVKQDIQDILKEIREGDIYHLEEILRESYYGMSDSEIRELYDQRI